MLDYTGGGRRGVEQAEANADYLRHQLEAARLAVMGNTLRQAVQVATLRSQIKTVNDLIGRDRENLRLVQVAFQAGSVARLDIVSAQSQLAADETLLPTLDQQLSVAQHALAVLAGNTPATGAGQIDLDLSKLRLPEDIMVSVPSELARHRPDILAAEAQLHASTAAVGVAEANLYPRITISASGGLQSSQFSHLFDNGPVCSALVPAWSRRSLMAAPYALKNAPPWQKCRPQRPTTSRLCSRRSSRWPILSKRCITTQTSR